MKGALIFAKKLRLPSRQANVMQSLHMALGFERAGARLRVFPGCDAADDSGRQQILAQSFAAMGVDDAPRDWPLLSGRSKGGYGIRFRLAVLRAALADTDAVLFTRDIAEAQFLCTLKRFVGRPFFYEMHEVLWRQHRDESGKDWQATRQREQRALAAALGLVTTSKLIAEQVREDFGYRGPLLVARNGFSPEIFHPLPLFSEENPWPVPDAGEAGQTVSLVYVGNFHPGKGVEELLRALALLPGQYQLRIVGGSPEKAFAGCRALAETLGLGDRVTFAGAVPQREVRAQCAGAHIFVIPQQSDFFFSPLKLYEAFALGLPVVLTPLALFDEQRRKGLVHTAKSGTAEGLADAIAELVRTPDLARTLRDKAMTEAGEHTWRHRAERVLGFMAKTLADQNVPPPTRMA